MSENTGNIYGYQDDEEAISSTSNIVFGLNPLQLVNFNYITNAGKDGAEGEALEIVWNVNGTEKRQRLFPITKAFIKGSKSSEETTDPTHPDFREEVKNFNAIMTHILSLFVTKEQIILAFGKPITSFKMYCDTAKSLLSKEDREKLLQIFMQYQWSIKGDNTRTFLEIPSKMKHGRFLCQAVEARKADGSLGGKWTLVHDKEADDNVKDAIHFVDEMGNQHPHFVRNGWYAKSNFANKQSEDEDEAINASPSNTAGVSQGAAPSAGSEDAGSGWD